MGVEREVGMEGWWWWSGGWGWRGGGDGVANSFFIDYTKS